MNIKSTPLLLLILLLTSIMSCKERSDSIAPVVKDIYICGTVFSDDSVHTSVAKYWKNGIEVTLTEKKNQQNSRVHATGIRVEKGDVYVVGYSENIEKNIYNAKYWKNGEEILLFDNTPNAIAVDIKVVGNDVYVAGYEFRGKVAVACYWKNKNSIKLTDGTNDSYATGICVVDNNVYVAGNENGYPKYWKNGVEVNLSLSKKTGYIKTAGIVVSKNDIYILGNQYIGKEAVAIYWKNGVEVKLSDATKSNIAQYITIAGNDVYIAGYELKENTLPGPALNTYFAKYWKNGDEVILSDGTKPAVAHAIQVVGTDVFAVGVEGSQAKYWKNGKPVDLGSPAKYTSLATGISIVTN